MRMPRYIEVMLLRYWPARHMAQNMLRAETSRKASLRKKQQFAGMCVPIWKRYWMLGWLKWNPNLTICSRFAPAIWSSVNRTAVAKLAERRYHRLVPRASEHRLGQLLDRGNPSLFAIKGFDGQSADSLSHQLPVLEQAMTHHLQCWLITKDQRKQLFSPYQLVNYKGTWHLVGVSEGGCKIR